MKENFRSYEEEMLKGALEKQCVSKEVTFP